MNGEWGNHFSQIHVSNEKDSHRAENCSFGGSDDVALAFHSFEADWPDSKATSITWAVRHHRLRYSGRYGSSRVRLRFLFTTDSVGLAAHRIQMRRADHWQSEGVGGSCRSQTRSSRPRVATCCSRFFERPNCQPANAQSDGAYLRCKHKRVSLHQRRLSDHFRLGSVAASSGALHTGSWKETRTGSQQLLWSVFVQKPILSNGPYEQHRR